MRYRSSFSATTLFRSSTLPVGLFTVTSSVILGLIILYVDPFVIQQLPPKNSYLFFLLLVFGWLMGGLTLLSVSRIRSIVWAGSLCLLLFLRVIGMGHILNAGLIGMGLFLFEYYRRIHPPSLDSSQDFD